MLERLGMHLRLGISPDAVTLVRAGRQSGQCRLVAEQRVAAEPGAAYEGIASALHGLFGAYDGPRLPLRLVLADGLVRHWMVTPPQNGLRQSDCRAAAAFRFQTLYGEPLGDWHLAADWDARRPFLACALPGALLALLQGAAAAQRLPVLEIAPQFVVAWNHWRRAIAPHAWFGLVGSGMLTVAVTRGTCLQALRAAALPAAAWSDAPALARHLAREALRLDVPMPPLLQLCGDLPDDLPQRWALPLSSDTNGGPALQCMRLGASSPLGASSQPHAFNTSAGVQLALTGAYL
jgi:hypothetical protein